MAEYTTNYSLKKPAQEDFYNVEDFNGNADIVDGALKRIKEDGNAHATDQTNPHNVTAAQVGASNPNLLINGDFKVWQRGTEFDGFLRGDVYAADRWVSSNSPVKKVERVLNTSSAPCKYACKITLGGDRFNIFYQPLEFIDDINGKTVTVSFYIRSSKNMGLSCVVGVDGEYDLTYVTDQWQRVFFTRQVDKGSSLYQQGVRLFTGIDSENENEWYEITGVKLELGSVATTFVPRSYGEELAACRRYYEKIDIYNGMYCDVAGNILAPIHYSPKRIAPTIRYHDWSGNAGRIHYQPIGHGGGDFDTDVYDINLGLCSARLSLANRSDITVTPAVGSIIIRDLEIDAEIY